MKKSLILLMACTVAIASCKKDSQSTSNTSSKTSLLTKASWKMSSYGVDVNMDGVLTGSENETQSCALDDTYTFTTAGAAAYNPGTLKCGSETSFTTTWQFYLSETKMDFLGDSYDISELTETRLVLKHVGPASVAMRILVK